MIKVDTLHERLTQAMACVSAIHVSLTDREVDPDGTHMSDSVLQGLAFAAGELLRQANVAAKGWDHDK